MRSTSPELKLIALEPDELTLVSAQLQDAVVKVADIVFDQPSKRVVLLCNRFDWQGEIARPAQHERRRARVRIERAERLRVQGIDQTEPAAVLSILALTFAPAPSPEQAPAGTLTINCAGGATLQLDVECVELALEDLGPAWQARRAPDHRAD